MEEDWEYFNEDEGNVVEDAKMDDVKIMGEIEEMEEAGGMAHVVDYDEDYYDELNKVNKQNEKVQILKREEEAKKKKEKNIGAKFSSGEEDDDEESQEDVIKNIQILQEIIEQDQYNLYAYNKLIQLYSKHDYVQEAKYAREYVSQFMSLSLDMWKNWINDEKRQAKTLQQNIDVLSIYDKALECFSYFSISEEYIQFGETLYQNALQNEKEDSFNAEHLRKIYEKVLHIWLLDFSKSTELWEKYFEFETALLENAETDELKEEQIKKIRALYRRKLNFPSIDIDLIWDDYKSWEKNKYEHEIVKKKYEKSTEKVQKFITFEEKFNTAFTLIENKEDFDGMIKLLKEELPALAGQYFNYYQLYYEKVLCEFPDNEELWNLYLQQMQSHNKQSSLREGFFRRALKNIPSNVHYRIELMRENERMGKESSLIAAIALEALELISDPFYHYIIRKELCEYYARLIQPNLKEEDPEVFNQTVEQMRQYYLETITQMRTKQETSALADKLVLNWGEIETYKVFDKEKAFEVMQDLIKQNGSQTEYWLNYIRFARHFNETKLIRNLCRKGLQQAKDFRTIGDAWEEWEKKFGTIQSLMECQNKIQKRKERAEASLKSVRQRELLDNAKKGERKPHGKRQEGESGIKEERKTKRSVKERKYEDERSDSKREREDFHEKRIPPPLEERNTLFIKNLDKSMTEEQLESIILNSIHNIAIISVRIIRNAEGISRGFGYVDVQTKQMAQDCLQLDDLEVANKRIKVFLSKPPSKDADSRTVFVGNLPHDVTQQQLHQLFITAGEIVEIRIIKDLETGENKGYAYIEYKSEDVLGKALALNKVSLQDKVLNVSQAISDKTKRNQAENTIHINNLPFSAGKEDIRKFFKDCGEILDLKLIADEGGRSKGFGFLQFVSEEGVKKAFNLNHSMLMGRNIIIKKSERKITAVKTRTAEHRPIEPDFEISGQDKRKRKPPNRLEKAEKPKKKKIDLKEGGETEMRTQDSEHNPNVVKSNADFKQMLFNK